MQPTDSWHLCFTAEFMLCQVPHRLCSLSLGQGSCQGIPGETHSWEVIEFEGKRQHRKEERIVQPQRRMTAAGACKGMHRCSAQGVCYLFIFPKERSGSSCLFNVLHSSDVLRGIHFDKYTSCVYFLALRCEGCKWHFEARASQTHHDPAPSHYIPAQMTECSKCICIWAFLFDLYCILMYFFFLPSSLRAHSWLTSRSPLPPPTHTLHTSVIPFSDIRQEKGECKSPICTHYTECVRSWTTQAEKIAKKKKRKEKPQNAQLWNRSPQGAAEHLVWYRNLCFGWHFKENATMKHKYTRGRLFYMHLHMQANPLNISSWILMGAEISGDKHKPSRITFINIALHSTHPASTFPVQWFYQDI